MSKRKVRVEGINDLRRRLKKLDAESRTEVKQAISEMAKETAELARGRVGPVSSNIAAAITHRVEKDGMGARVGIITKRNRQKAWYAHFVEWGTRKWGRVPVAPGQQSRPFLMPSFEQARAKHGERIRAAINKLVNEK